MDDTGLHVFGGRVRRHVHMGDEADGIALKVRDIAGDAAEQITVFVQTNVRKAQLLHLFFQPAGQLPLPFGTGYLILRRVRVGGGGYLNVFDQALIGFHKDLLWKLYAYIIHLSDASVQ